MEVSEQKSGGVGRDVLRHRAHGGGHVSELGLAAENLLLRLWLTANHIEEAC